MPGEPFHVLAAKDFTSRNPALSGLCPGGHDRLPALSGAWGRKTVQQGQDVAKAASPLRAEHL